MNEQDLEINTMQLKLKVLGDGTLGVWAGQNIDAASLDPGACQYFIDALNGIRVQIDTNLDHLAHVGAMVRFIAERTEEEEDEDELVFEPDPEFIKKVEEAKIKEANGKVVNFSKKIH